MLFFVGAAMEHSTNRRLPLARILVESLAIVASILLAFLIDAWWDTSRDRIEEREILEDLRIELTANVEAARRTAAMHRGYSERIAALETLTERQAVALLPDSARAYVVAGYAWPTFDPATGTVDGVTSSGRIEVVSDAELRSHLADWLRRLNDVREEAELMTRAAERFIGRLAEYGPLPDADASIARARLVSLLHDGGLMGAGRTKAWYGRMYSGELSRHADFAEELLSLIAGRERIIGK